MRQLRLVLLSGNYVRRSVELGDDPISIGRGPINQFNIRDSSVSWHHAMVWMEQRTAYVRDLGSSNGTFLNGVQVDGSLRMRPGDRIRVGEHLELVLQGAASGWVPWERSLAITDLDRGGERLFESDRFTLGVGKGVDYELGVGPPVGVTLMVHGNGEIWKGEDHSISPVLIEQPFYFAGHRFKLKELDPTQYPVATYQPGRYPYKLKASTDGQTATLTDPVTGQTREFSGKRSGLLLLLAQSFRSSNAEDHAARGWLTNTEVGTALWHDHNPVSRLNVLVYRLRRAMARAGLSPWCIEQRDGHIRIRIGLSHSQ